MVVPEGYKQTDVGILPNDWYAVKLCEICEPNSNRLNPILVDEEFKCIELEHLSQGTGQLIGYTTSKQVRSMKAIFKKGDILFGKLRPYLKKYLFAEFNGICTTEIWVLRPQKDYDNNWLYYTVQSNRFIEAANQSTGTKMPRAEWKIVSNVKFPIPPTLAEQTAIATALSDMDALISNLEKLITKKRLIKQGAMQQLLKPKEGWQCKTLKEIAIFRRESFPQPYGLDKWYDDHNGTPFVQVYDVDDNFCLKNETKRKISKEGQIFSVFVKKGSIVLTIQGSIGRIAITNYDSYVDRTLLIFESFLLPFDNYFFALIIYLKFKEEKENAPGAVIKTITKEALSSFKFFFPDLKEQCEISKVIQDAENEIVMLERKLDKFFLLKQGMMQNLLTGKIRLI